MKIASTIARYLLALVFIVFGLNGFLHFIPQPPPPSGLAGEYFKVMFTSHYLVVCLWAATARGRVVSVSTNRAVGVDVLGAVDRQHSAVPCADGSGRNCARSRGDGSVVRDFLAVPRGFLWNSLPRYNVEIGASHERDPLSTFPPARPDAAKPHRPVAHDPRQGGSCSPAKPTDGRVLRPRSSAGLLITEATTISEQANGWNESPGIYTDAMTEGWKHTTGAVHEQGSVIFLQLWHTGRASHSSFHGGRPAVAPSAIKINEPEIHTPIGKQPHEVPRALETSEIPRIVNDYRQAAERAKQAGFDGVEIHAANGYLIDEFLQSKTNHRTDEYGGSVENRYRFLKEVTEAVTSVWPANRVGVHLSPNGQFNDMGSPDYPGAVHIRRRSTRSLRFGVSARRGRAGVRLPQSGRADDAGRVPQGVPRPTHGQLRLQPGNGGARDCRGTRRPDLLRATFHQQPGPRGAIQKRLAACRTSANVRLVVAHRGERVHGFPGLCIVAHSELRPRVIRQIPFVFRPSTGLTFRGDCLYANGVAPVSLGLAAVRGGLPQVRGRAGFFLRQRRCAPKRA